MDLDITGNNVTPGLIMIVDFKFLCLTAIVRLTFNLRDRGIDKEDDITEETDEDN